MREPTRLLVLRHGQTDWNAATRIQGQTDIPLNALGQAQAAQMAKALAGETLDTIYSSDLQRALQTAQALAATTHAPLLTLQSLRERGFGSFETHTYAELEALWPDDVRRWRQREPDFSPGGGESLTVFSKRCVDAVTALAAAHAGAQIAVVAHGGVLDCLYRAAVGVSLDAPRTWQLGNASINRLLWNGEHFSLVGWNDNAHLDGMATTRVED